MNARYTSNQTLSEAAGNPGNSFWSSVWKRIEVDQARPDQLTSGRQLPPQPPLDYAVESEGAYLAG